MTKGKRGGGSKHQLLWEEVPFLKVEKTGKPVAIYKREDVQKDLPLEQRNYYAHFPPSEGPEASGCPFWSLKGKTR